MMENKRKFFVKDEIINGEKKFFICYYDKDGIKTVDAEHLIFDDFKVAYSFVENGSKELNDLLESLEAKDETTKKNKSGIKLISSKSKNKTAADDDESKEEITKNKKTGNFKRYLSGFLAGVVLLTGGHFVAKGVSSSIKERKTENAIEDTLLEDTVVENNIINDAISSIATKDEEYNTENFEKIVAEYAKNYVDNNISVTTEDLVKFVSIANIDKLAEENPELASELFSVQTKEEYLNDAAKVIGATVMYNYELYSKNLTTEGFIKVSDALVGEQKDNMIKIEEYTDKIAKAVKEENGELVNSLVNEFIVELNSGALSTLDDGVGFAAQVNIALISDVIARNYLNQENFDMLQILKTGERYVSNIFTVYENCNEVQDVKTLTR